MNAPLRHPIAVLKERPFDGRLRVLEVDWARAPSIAEILDSQAGVTDEFHARCVALVNDEIVPRAMWAYVRPRPCCIRDGKVIDVVVIFRLALGNGGGSGGSGGGAKKNPVVTVASIAVLLAATVASGGALGPAGIGLLGAGFGAGTFGAALVGAGIGLGGRIVADALKVPS